MAKTFEFDVDPGMDEEGLNDFIQGLNSLKGEGAAMIVSVTMRRIVTERADVAAVIETIALPVGAGGTRKREPKAAVKVYERKGPEPTGIPINQL